MTTDENTIMEMLENTTEWSIVKFIHKEKTVVEHISHRVRTFWWHFDNTSADALTNACKVIDALWYISNPCTDSVCVVIIPMKEVN